MFIDIQFDEYRYVHICCARCFGKLFDCCDVVGNDFEIGVASQECEDVSELRWRNVYGIDDVADPMSEEVLGFFESRDCDVVWCVVQRMVYDIDRFCCLHVGLQYAVESMNVRAHAFEVAIELAVIDDECGGFEVCQLYQCSILYSMVMTTCAILLMVLLSYVLLYL